MAALVIAEHDHHSIKGATLTTVTAALKCDPQVPVLVAGANARYQPHVISRIAARHRAWLTRFHVMYGLQALADCNRRALLQKGGAKNFYATAHPRAEQVRSSISKRSGSHAG